MVVTSFTIVISGLTIDTNILIYSIDRRDPSKHRIGSSITETCLDNGCVVALQAINEFFRAVTRKGLLPDVEAIRFVHGVLGAMHVVAPNEGDLVHAMTAHRRYKIRFFDALLLATVQRAGCTILLSEDMQHEGIYDGIQVINPFKISDADLVDLMV